MVPRVMRGFLSVCLATVLFGCADVVQRAKDPVPEPRILEEDVTEPKSQTEGMHEGPTLPSLEPPPVTSPPPAVEHGNRPPRRIPWRDR